MYNLVKSESKPVTAILKDRFFDKGILAFHTIFQEEKEDTFSLKIFYLDSKTYVKVILSLEGV